MKMRSISGPGIFKGIFLFLILHFFFFVPGAVDAGFGVTPPYFQNSELTRNSVYEQKILLVRSRPDFDLLAEIEVDVPGADEWITIEPGKEVLMPKDERMVSIVVSILVPDKADFGDYRGNIRIRTSPVHDEDRGGGAVSIALGARINVNLSVIDRVIREFEVRKVEILDFNEGRKVRWLEYPGKMIFNMALRNVGNVPVSPDKVEVDIYDSSGKKLLERTTHTNKIKRVPPFKTEEVFAELPSHLPPGSYRGKFRIYNDDKEVRSGELTFNIRPAGTIPGDSGYGFMGLSLWHKTTIVGPIIIAVTLIFSLILYFSKRSRLLFMKALSSWRSIYRYPIERVRRFVSLVFKGFGGRKLSRD